ncbi:MAG: hypothetical protein RLZZ519_1787 [Bacteroidota bacterium]|jgi:hypothetical protein
MKNRYKIHQKGWLIGAVLMAAVMLIAQRPNRKNPSPADPGMQFAVPKKGRTNPELPSPPPPTDDPNGGISDNDDEIDPNGGISAEEDEVPTHGDMPEEPAEDKPFDLSAPPPPLQVAKTEIWKIGNGSEVGEAGDWMLVLQGQGFVEAERPPVVHIGEDVILSEVYVAKRGQELFARIPAALAAQLKAIDFDNIWVQNPGGLNRDRKRWVPFLIQRPSFVSAMDVAPKATFKFGAYFLERGK